MYAVTIQFLLADPASVITTTTTTYRRVGQHTTLKTLVHRRNESSGEPHLDPPEYRRSYPDARVVNLDDSRQHASAATRSGELHSLSKGKRMLPSRDNLNQSSLFTAKAEKISYPSQRAASSAPLRLIYLGTANSMASSSRFSSLCFGYSAESALASRRKSGPRSSSPLSKALKPFVRPLACKSIAACTRSKVVAS